jgi:hypothetical protein
MTVQERIKYKKQYIKSLIDAFDYSSNMFYRDCMAYLIDEELKDLKRIKLKYGH